MKQGEHRKNKKEKEQTLKKNKTKETNYMNIRYCFHYSIFLSKIMKKRKSKVSTKEKAKEEI